MNQFKNKQNATLFSLKSNFRLFELDAEDASTQNDHLQALRDFVCSSEPMYPGIQSWFNDKVIPGLKSTARVAYIAYENDIPIASAILKRGLRSKICHLKIAEDFQDLHLGQMFFTQMIAKILNEAKEIHFTLPESLWASRSRFFDSFGFSSTIKAQRQYRSGDDELLCSAPVKQAWDAALERVPELVQRFSINGTNLDTSVLLSIKPKFAERILAGEKSIEIRKKFSRKWLGKRVVLYASNPTGSIVGHATIASIEEGSPNEIWSRFKGEIGCPETQFEQYVGSCLRISAIRLSDVERYQTPIPRCQIADLTHGKLVPPQSHLELNFKRYRAWEKAISLTALLHLSAQGRQVSAPPRAHVLPCGVR